MSAPVSSVSSDACPAPSSLSSASLGYAMDNLRSAIDFLVSAVRTADDVSAVRDVLQRAILRLEDAHDDSAHRSLMGLLGLNGHSIHSPTSKLKLPRPQNTAPTATTAHTAADTSNSRASRTRSKTCKSSADGAVIDGRVHRFALVCDTAPQQHALTANAAPSVTSPLHERLSSPERKRFVHLSVEEAKRSLVSKQLNAARNRDHTLSARAQKLRIQQARAEEIMDKQAKRLTQKSQSSEERLITAELKHDEHLDEIRRRAESANTKVKEIAFIHVNSSEAASCERAIQLAKKLSLTEQRRVAHQQAKLAVVSQINAKHNEILAKRRLATAPSHDDINAKLERAERRRKLARLNGRNKHATSDALDDADADADADADDITPRPTHSAPALTAPHNTRPDTSPDAATTQRASDEHDGAVGYYCRDCQAPISERDVREHRHDNTADDRNITQTLTIAHGKDSDDADVDANADDADMTCAPPRDSRSRRRNNKKKARKLKQIILTNDKRTRNELAAIHPRTDTATRHIINAVTAYRQHREHSVVLSAISNFDRANGQELLTPSDCALLVATLLRECVCSIGTVSQTNALADDVSALATTTANCVRGCLQRFTSPPLIDTSVVIQTTTVTARIVAHYALSLTANAVSASGMSALLLALVDVVSLTMAATADRGALIRYIALAGMIDRCAVIVERDQDERIRRRVLRLIQEIATADAQRPYTAALRTAFTNTAAAGAFALLLSAKTHSAALIIAAVRVLAAVCAADAELLRQIARANPTINSETADAVTAMMISPRQHDELASVLKAIR